MPIQFDNTNTGSVTLKGPFSSTSTLAWPSANGTSNQVLVTDGAGTLSWVALSSPSVAGFTLASASNSITASGGTTDQVAALIPKGSGGFCLNLPDGTSTGGNARGLYSIDLASTRGSASSVTSGTYGISLGNYNNTVEGNNGSVIGGSYSTTVSSSYSFAFGTNYSILQADNCMILGRYADTSGTVTTTINYTSQYMTIAGGATTSYSQSYANYGYMFSLPAFAANSSVIGGLSYTYRGTKSYDVQLGGVTTNSNLKELTTNAAAVSTNNYIGYATTTVIHGTAVARASDGTTKTWYFRYVGTSEGVVSGTITIISADSGASAWDFTITKPASSSRFAFNALGDVALTTRWFVRVYVLP